MAVAQQVGTNPTAAGVANAAKLAFVHAMTSTVYIGAAFALAGAVFAFCWLPARPADEPGEPSAGEAGGGGLAAALPIGSVPLAR